MIISYFLIPYQLENHWCSILTAAQELLYQSKNDIIDFYLLHLKDKSHATHGAAFEAIICNLVVTYVYNVWVGLFFIVNDGNVSLVMYLWWLL